MVPPEPIRLPSFGRHVCGGGSWCPGGLLLGLGGRIVWSPADHRFGVVWLLCFLTWVYYLGRDLVIVLVLALWLLLCLYRSTTAYVWFTWLFELGLAGIIHFMHNDCPILELWCCCDVVCGVSTVYAF